MRDINSIMPKIDGMKWGALTNRRPTKNNLQELNRLLPHNGKWHTVFEHHDNTVAVDGHIIRKYPLRRWT